LIIGMAELEEIKNKIADTEAKLKKAEEEAKISRDYTRRDRLEVLLTEQQKEKNFHLTGAGAAADRRVSTGSESHVFCLIDTASNIPVGTVFAIAPTLLLSANHNRLDVDSGLPFDVSITKLLHKRDGVISPPNDKVDLKVLAYNTEEDWVVFQRTDSEVFQTVAVLCEEQDLPDENSEHNEIVTVRYYNAGLFQKKLKQLHRKAQILMYQECEDVDLTQSAEDEAEIVVSDGAVRGVCGAPYYFDGKVVAFHVESDNEALKFSKEHNLEKMVESLSTTYSHFSIGRVLCRLPAFMKLYRRNFQIKILKTRAASTKASNNVVKKSTTASKKNASTLPKGKKIPATTRGAATAGKKRKFGSLA